MTAGAATDDTRAQSSGPVVGPCRRALSLSPVVASATEHRLPPSNRGTTVPRYSLASLPRFNSGKGIQAIRKQEGLGPGFEGGWCTKIMAKHLAIPARRTHEWIFSLGRTHSLARRASGCPETETARVFRDNNEKNSLKTEPPKGFTR